MESVENTLINIGNKLMGLRIKNGFISLEDFVLDNNLSRMHYWRIEKGKTNFTIKSLAKILAIHNISIEDFFSNAA
ncbi:MAG: helix-turn-helix transcriptional regulator [Bacteroidia bacterium]